MTKMILHFRNMQLTETENLISTIRFDNDTRLWQFNGNWPPTPRNPWGNWGEPPMTIRTQKTEFTMKHISFDAARCVGCQICQLVCSGTWRRVFNPLKANLRVEQTGWYGQFSAHICLQKEDAECVNACPTGALYVDRIKGFVQFDKKKCDGCQLCVNECPHDAIFVHPDDQHIYKCHLCGGGKVQQCVQACPVNALRLEEAPS